MLGGETLISLCFMKVKVGSVDYVVVLGKVLDARNGRRMREANYERRGKRGKSDIYLVRALRKGIWCVEGFPKRGTMSEYAALFGCV